jgi:hypothetical protein
MFGPARASSEVNYNGDYILQPQHPDECHQKMQDFWAAKATWRRWELRDEENAMLESSRAGTSMIRNIGTELIQRDIVR